MKLIMHVCFFSKIETIDSWVAKLSRFYRNYEKNLELEIDGTSLTYLIQGLLLLVLIVEKSKNLSI